MAEKKEEEEEEENLLQEPQAVEDAWRRWLQVVVEEEPGSASLIHPAKTVTGVRVARGGL